MLQEYFWPATDDEFSDEFERMEIHGNVYGAISSTAVLFILKALKFGDFNALKQLLKPSFKIKNYIHF